MKRIRSKSGLFLLAVFLLALCCVGIRVSASSPTIRVRILTGKSKVRVGATGDYEVQAPGSTRKLLFPSSHSALTIEASQQGIRASGKIWGSQVLIKPVGAQSLIRVGTRRYRGRIFVQQKESLLEIVNELPLEEYLWGVIKPEISPKWPRTSILAFTIAARTYAFKKLNSSSAESSGHHISSEQDDQVYRGVEGEDSYARELVNETRGRVLTYLGEIIEASYHACCGGYTASSKDVWGGKERPYSVAKRDDFCKKSPYFTWESRIEVEDLRERLKKRGLVLGRIYRIKLLEFDEGRRVNKLQIEHQAGKTELTGKEFRTFVGGGDLKSTLFTVRRYHRYFVFEGKGWGHGVGLCQEGAKVMGERGYTHKEILEFYYPGAIIENAY